jgi:hypothetical protein
MFESFLRLRSSTLCPILSLGTSNEARGWHRRFLQLQLLFLSALALRLLPLLLPLLLLGGLLMRCLHDERQDIVIDLHILLFIFIGILIVILFVVIFIKLQEIFFLFLVTRTSRGSGGDSGRGNES